MGVQSPGILRSSHAYMDLSHFPDRIFRTVANFLPFGHRMERRPYALDVLRQSEPQIG